MKKTIALLCFFIIQNQFSQNSEKSVFVPYTENPITLDANLDESEWQNNKGASSFWQYFPSDSVQAKQQAHIKFLFDDDNLYVGIRVNSSGENYIVPSLRRDFRAGGSDNITMLFDTFNDGTNAFIFGTNPYGVKREILLSGGGSDLRGFTGAWDTKWQSKTAIKDKHYIIEMIIPLSAFKYREGETKWRFNSYHFDTQDNERNTWIRIPQNQLIFSLAYMGDMIFERPLGKSKSPISVIPFINAISSKDHENNTSSSDFKYGADAKMTIGNSLNLDLTINPDFSQIEVDQQVTNLTRFEVSLPERRQFFIENSDLFNDFGNSRDADAFFSRRIGIAKDLNENSIQNDIIAGARLSGKLNNDLRIGLLSMQTAEDLTNNIPSVNNSVVTLQHKFFSRSNLSFMFINKQATKNYAFLDNTDDDTSNNSFNRVLGVDYRLASKDNSWLGKYFIHKSFSPDRDDKDYSAGFSTEYFSRKYNFRVSGAFVGENFNSELGFVRRTDILKITPKIQRNFWPQKGVLQKHNFSITPIFIWKPGLNYQNSDYAIFSKWEGSFRDNSEISFNMSNRFTYLYSEFNPSGVDDATPLDANTGYKYTSFGADYRSDQRKKLSFRINSSIGQFYNGQKYSFRTNLNLRLQPYFTSSLQVNYDQINLPKPYGSASIWLVGSKFDVTFNKSMFWSTFLQYSTQQQTFSVNTRFQWRFAPLSDLFIVYNDNYFSDPFGPRFRSINLKLSYWLNI